MAGPTYKILGFGLDAPDKGKRSPGDVTIEFVHSDGSTSTQTVRLPVNDPDSLHAAVCEYNEAYEAGLAVEKAAADESVPLEVLAMADGKIRSAEMVS